MKLFWVADVGLILLKWQHSKLISLSYLFGSWPCKAKHYTPWEFSPYFTLRQQQHWHCLHWMFTFWHTRHLSLLTTGQMEEWNFVHFDASGLNSLFVSLTSERPLHREQVDLFLMVSRIMLKNCMCTTSAAFGCAHTLFIFQKPIVCVTCLEFIIFESSW